MEDESLMKKKRVKIILMSVAGVLLLLAIFFFVSGNGNSDLRNHLFMGEKYLEDLDYEQALAEYKAVLEIDSENEDAIAGIETVSLLYTESLLVETNNVSVEELNGLLVVLEDSYQLTKAASVQEKVSEVKTVIEDKRAEEDRLAEEAKKLEEEKKKQEEEIQKNTEEAKAVLNNFLGYIENIMNTIYQQGFIGNKKGIQVIYWNTVEKITITDIEENCWEIEAFIYISTREFYIYKIDKDTLQGRLIRYYGIDDISDEIFAEEEYANEPLIDFSQFNVSDDEEIKNVDMEIIVSGRSENYRLTS